MVYYGALWNFKVYYGILWHIVVYCGIYTAIYIIQYILCNILCYIMVRKCEELVFPASFIWCINRMLYYVCVSVSIVSVIRQPSLASHSIDKAIARQTGAPPPVLLVCITRTPARYTVPRGGLCYHQQQLRSHHGRPSVRRRCWVALNTNGNCYRLTDISSCASLTFSWYLRYLRYYSID